MPPRRRRRAREEGVVEVSIGHDQPSAGSGAGFDLDNVALSDANLVDRMMQLFSIYPKAPNAREQLHRALTKATRPVRRGRKPGGLRLHVEMALAKASDKDTAPAAARKIQGHQGRKAGLDGLIQKIRRERRKTTPR